MLDMDRDALTEMVYRRLANPSFRRRLTARAPDGSHPLVIATREELVESMLHRLEVVGGSGNVVVPMLNGLVVLAMDAVNPEAEDAVDTPCAITTDCTVGVLVERMSLDQGGVYRFVVEGHAKPRGGHAEVVALAG